MGAIHVELGQWKDAASCFRQCLSILKRNGEREGMQNNVMMKSTQESQQFQVSITLQCLGNCLNELGEYAASIACFQDALETSKDKGAPHFCLPESFLGDVLSQIARVHLNEASKLSFSLNWKCHLLLFSENESEKEDNPGSTLARQLQRQQSIVRNGKECIIKAIHSRRKICYAASVRKESEPNGDTFLSQDKTSQVSANVSTELTFSVSVNAPPLQLAELSKDLLAAGQIEFRSRSYKTALSYCWESFLLGVLFISRSSEEVESCNDISDLLVFVMKLGTALYEVPDDILSRINKVNIPTDVSAEVKLVQVLFLIAISYTRSNNFDKAKAVMIKAQAILDPTKLPAETKDTLKEAVNQLDIAHLYLRIGFVHSIEKNFDVAAISYKKAIQIFNSTASHPILSNDGRVNRELDDDDKWISSLDEFQRKKLEMIIKNGLACTLHRLGQIYTAKGRADKAMKCLEDTALILNDVNEIRTEALDWSLVPSLPLASNCFLEEISAVSTSMILSDVNQRSGHMSMDGVSHLFSLQCFERAVGMRNYITTSLGSLTTMDTEISLEWLEEQIWDKRNMECYMAMLMLIERGEANKKPTQGEEIYSKFGADTVLGSGEALTDVHHLTREDVLFRIGKWLRLLFLQLIKCGREMLISSNTIMLMRQL